MRCCPQPDPLTVLGVDETRRGKGKGETDPGSGERPWVDRFDTGLVDITGRQGSLTPVKGRDAQTVIDWLDERGQTFQAVVRQDTMDMSASYAKAIVRRCRMPRSSWTGFIW